MKISPIRYNYNQSFLGFRSEKDNENKGFVDTINSKIPTSFTRTQVAGSVLFAVFVGMGLRHGKIKSEKYKNLKLSEELEHAKNKFSSFIENSLTPKDLREKIYEKFSQKIAEGNLGYDVSSPPVTGLEKPKVYPDAFDLPKDVKTNNRSFIKELSIPEIGSDGSFDFNLPWTSQIKVVQAERKSFTPVHNCKTSITESYSESVKWTNDKIARDILQNFYDGHGQTLDGVKFKFEPLQNGKVRVKISGDGTYTPDKAIYLGESTKRDDASAAGNYGEGLKMSALKLLKDSGTDNVKFASDNWQLNYKFQEDSLLGKRVLAYDLDEITPIQGNYLEFETSDKSLLETFRKSINRFYHSGNEHFKSPDFENDLLGIKLLPEGEKGAIYIAGQRFEYNDDYDGFPSAVIFLKEKPETRYLNLSRDRISLSENNLENIARWFTRSSYDNQNGKMVRKCMLPKPEAVKFLRAMDKYWDLTKQGPMNTFFNAVLAMNYDSAIHIKFPKNYVAYSPASQEVVTDLTSKGIRVCKADFSYYGMPTIRQFVGNARSHAVVSPSENQKKKILILKEAINVFKKSLKDKHFTESELNTKIFLFNNRSEKEKGLYNNVLAEAIIDNEVSKGFWIDSEYLDKASFSEALETALHELSHKAGGDESEEFSYKLTNVNKAVIGQIVEDVQSRAGIQSLNKLWDEIGS